MNYDVFRKAWAHRSVRLSVALLLALLGVWLRLRSLPDEGYFYDLKVISSWGRIISLFGWTDVYRHQLSGLSAANYPPGNLAIMGAVVRIHDAFGGSLQPGGAFLNALMKLPACIADAWLSLILFAVVRKFSTVRIAVVAGLMYWLNPGVWLLSAVWGQTDGVYTAFSFAGLAAAMLGFPLLAGAIVALSIFIKIQGIILAPVAVILMLRRPKDIVPFLAGALPVLLLFLPFVFADRFADVIWVYTKAPGLPEFVSFNAYNFWWGIFSYGSSYVVDTGRILNIISYRYLGYVLTIACYLIVLRRLLLFLRSNPDPRCRTQAALATAILCNIAFFFFMTRMQQRYTMVFFPCAIVLGCMVAHGRRHLIFLFASFVINTLFVISPYFFPVTIGVVGRIGWVLAWINLFVAADLAAIWWKTILAPPSFAKVQKQHWMPVIRKALLRNFLPIVFFAALAGIALRFGELLGAGSFGDLPLITQWGNVVRESGWTNGYSTGANYPPISMAIFGAMTKVHVFLGGNAVPGAASLNALMKFPAIFADLWLSIFIFAILRRFASVRTACCGGIACFLYPALWLVSSYWGQTDSIYISLAFGSLIASFVGLPFLGGFLLSFSVLTKLQSVILAPVIILVLLRKKTDALKAMISGLISTIVILTPFAFAAKIPHFIQMYMGPEILGLHSNLSFYTYNLWWAFFSTQSLSIGDRALFMNMISYRMIGFILTGLCFAAVLRRFLIVLRSHPTERRAFEAALAASILCSLAFFLLMTRIHTRYFFPLIPSAVVLIFLQSSGRLHILALLCSFCLNIYLMMFEWGVLASHNGLLGIALAWVNVFIALHLAIVWWFTILLPSDALLVQSSPHKPQIRVQ